MTCKDSKARSERTASRPDRRAPHSHVALAVSVTFLVVITSAWTLHSASLNRSISLANSIGPEPLFGPTIANSVGAPGSVPKGMVWIPGGEFSMGASDPPDMDEVGMKATTDARPVHRVYVDGFFMDKTDVTNAQFSEFVKATG